MTHLDDILQPFTGVLRLLLADELLVARAVVEAIVQPVNISALRGTSRRTLSTHKSVTIACDLSLPSLRSCSRLISGNRIESDLA